MVGSIDKYKNYKILYEKYLDQMYSYGMAFGVEENTLYDLIHDVFLHIFEHQNEMGEGNMRNITFFGV